VGVPIFLLAFDPMDDRVGVRSFVFALFLSGLLALFGYLFIAIRELRSPPFPAATDERQAAGLAGSDGRVAEGREAI
jgi:hypothetical protein